MASTVIDTRGTVDYSTGAGLTVNVAANFSNAVTMSYAPTLTATALTASGSVTYPGLYTLSNVSAAGYYLPNPASFPGGVYIFRSLGTAGEAHFLTGTVSDNLGRFISQGQVGVLTGTSANGSKLTLSSVVGSSVTMISDGLNFCVMANSGTLTFAGT